MESNVEKNSLKSNDSATVRANRDDVAKALDVLFAKDYISKKRLYYENFVRGIFFGAGGVIGATVLIAMLLWGLSLFDEVPLIGPFFENAKQTIENGSSLR